MKTVYQTAYFTCLGTFVFLSGVSAQIKTDASLGQSAQTLTGPNFAIPQTLGKLAGNNLFHSFETFNILSGQTANFTTDTAGINNVISRVTGGSLSQINGKLQLTPVSGTPGFFFINPAGVTLGAGASIDVPGAFHVSTANYLKFADGHFYADASKASTFSSASPEAFGFLGTTRASITVKDGAKLETKPLSPIGIVGGDIEVNNASITTQGSGVHILASGQKALDISVTGALPVSEGNLTILNGGNISSFSLGSIADETMALSAGTVIIDSQGNSTRTGITSQSVVGGTSQTMNVDVMASESLSLKNAGRIKATTASSGNAGAIKVNAGNVTMDGTGAAFLTGIWSDSTGTGGANRVELTATGNLSLNNSAAILSDSATSNNTHLSAVKVSAANVSIDGKGNPVVTGIYTESQMNAGHVDVTTPGNLSISNAGIISSNIFANGIPGAVKVNTSSLTIDGQGVSLPTGIVLQKSSGSIDVTATGAIAIVNNGRIYSSPSISGGTAATIKVSADSITLGSKGNITSDAESGTGKAGSIDVATQNKLTITDGGRISSTTFSSGDAGSVKVRAGSVAIDRQNSNKGTGIFSASLNQTSHAGNAGSVELSVVGDISMINGAEIFSDTESDASAGAIRVSADSLSISATSSIHSKVNSVAGAESAGGNAGAIDVTIAKNLDIGGEISSLVNTPGHAGLVKVNAGDITIQSGGGIYSKTGEFSANGQSGNVDVTATGYLSIFANGSISASTTTSKDAGTVKVAARSISIDGAQNIFVPTHISSDALGGSGNAGSVDVLATEKLTVANAGSISSTAFFGSGNAGTVTVAVPSGSLVVSNGGTVLSSTYTSGKGGILNISAKDIILDKGHFYNKAETNSKGNAETINVAATSLSLLHGATISAETLSSGSAGSVKVNVGILLVDGASSTTSSTIKASATSHSSGQIGTVVVNAADSITLTHAGELSIRNDATVTNPASISPTLLTVTAPTIVLKDAKITAASTGNVSASSIQITATDRLSIDPSSISTSANLGNGGSITLQGGKVMTLDNSQITTSVAGLTGNGGDIHVSADTLMMNTGFIQANTAAANAAGGLVGIDVQMLVPSGSSLFVGGQTPYSFQSGVFGLNVIQAAAPTGVSGTIQMTSPALDIAGSLNGLNAQVINTGGLGRSPCQITGGSSLAQSGRGGLAPSAVGLLRSEPDLVPAKPGTPTLGKVSLPLAFTPGRCS